MKKLSFVLTLFISILLACLPAQAQDKKDLDSLMRVYNTTKYDTTKILALTSIAQEYKNNKPDTCIVLASQALQMSEKMGFEKGKGWAKNRIAEGKLKLKDFKNAIALLAEAQTHFEKAQDTKGLAANYYTIARSYHYQNKPDLVVANYQKAIVLYEKIKDKESIAKSLNGIGVTYANQSNYPLALEYFKKSLQIRETFDSKKGISTLINNIGLIYTLQGNYPLALEYYQKSLKIQETTDDKSDMAGSLSSIGHIYKLQGNYTLALEYNQKGLKIAEETKDEYRLNTIINDIGAIYNKLGNRALALKYYQKSLQVNKAIGDSLGIARALGNIGLIYKIQGNYTLALEYYQKSQEIKEKIGDKRGLSNIFNNIAALAQNQQDYDKSILYAQKSLAIAQEINLPNNIVESSEILYETYKLKGDYVKALEYHELYKTMDDSLFNIEKAKKIATLEAKVEVERKEKEIEIFKKDAKIQQIETERQRNANLILEKEVEAKDLLYLASQEKDKRKQDSLRSLAQAKQLEIDKHLAVEDKLKAESEKRKIEVLKEKEAKEFQQYINALIVAVLLSVLILAYFIFRSRQKEKRVKESIAEQKEEIEQMNQELHTINEELVAQSEQLAETNEELSIQTEKLTIQTEQLAEANHTKTKLFSILGHDLRSPIGSLEGVLNLMNMGLVTQEEFQEFVPQFHKNVKNMQSTLENLLQWSISQMEGIDAKPIDASVGEIAQEQVNLFAEVGKAKNIQVQATVPENLSVWADENHVRLLLRNLINNALKFTPEGGKINIIAEAQPDLQTVVISVQDNGVGMTPEQVGKLFKKNESFTTYGTGGEKGTGLGLQLCQEIVTKNGGKIWVTSEKGKGSTFSFSLPALV